MLCNAANTFTENSWSIMLKNCIQLSDNRAPVTLVTSDTLKKSFLNKFFSLRKYKNIFNLGSKAIHHLTKCFAYAAKVKVIVVFHAHPIY